ncbi:hypothetical protein ACTD5D_04215 [Nocardia takedensis]|uniref:hypothetical protein n=1 Tax=Nocardia takedensis TaxID=259390 RepID=UPI0012F696DC|nr:hypothetical protein [Nocardia takedensis]
MSHEDGHVPGLFSHENVAPEAYTAADANAAHYLPVFSGMEDGSFQGQVDGDG